MNIRQANTEDLYQLTELFAQYRVFYGKDYDLDSCRKFLMERLNQKESVIFIALDDTVSAGFTQLYPSFSSVRLARIWILNDLFVASDHRQKGVAQLLINHVMAYCKTSGRNKVELSTAYDNFNAQQLYEKLGFTRSDFYNYELGV